MAFKRFRVEYAGVNCTDVGLYPVTRPAMPSPAQRVSPVEIPGRDGRLYVADGTIDDIVIDITFGFYGPENTWGDTFRRLKEWAANQYVWMYTKLRALRFSDDDEFFYDVKYTQVNTTERVARKFGRATVSFICDGWTYLYQGSYALTPDSGWTNFTIDNTTSNVAKPTITMICQSQTNFTVTRPDGTTKLFTFTGSPYRTNIDTRRQVIYHQANGDSLLNRTTGDFDAFWLFPGQTVISVDSTPYLFSLYPLWRVL